MSDVAFGLVSFPTLLALIFLRVPIGLAMLLTGLVGVLIMTARFICKTVSSNSNSSAREMRSGVETVTKPLTFESRL